MNQLSVLQLLWAFAMAIGPLYIWLKFLGVQLVLFEANTVWGRRFRKRAVTLVIGPALCCAVHMGFAVVFYFVYQSADIPMSYMAFSLFLYQGLALGMLAIESHFN